MCIFKVVTVAWRRFVITLPFALAMAAIAMLPMATAQGGFFSASSSGDIVLSGPTSDTTGPVAIPTYPGYLDTSSYAPTVGTAQYMAETWPAPTFGGSGPFVPFIPKAPPSFTPTFLSQSAGLGATSTLVGHVGVHYLLDPGGLAASTVSLSYPYIWAAGPSSLVTFDVLISFSDSDSVYGSPDDLHFHISKSGSVGSGTATAGPVFLPALPAGDSFFDVFATFTLTAFGAPGDGGPLIKTFGIPEPSTWMLAAIGFSGLCFAVRRRNR